MKVVAHVRDERIIQLLRVLNNEITSDLCLEKMKLLATFLNSETAENISIKGKSTGLESG